jgi:hypothetical protein
MGLWHSRLAQLPFYTRAAHSADQRAWPNPSRQASLHATHSLLSTTGVWAPSAISLSCVPPWLLPHRARVESLATAGLWGPLVSVITHLAHQPGRACRLRRRPWWSPSLAVELLRTDRPNPSLPNSAKSAASGIKYRGDYFPLLSISLPTTELFHGAQVRRPGSSVVPLLPGSTVPRLPPFYSTAALTSLAFGAWPTGPLDVAPAEGHGHITLKLLRPSARDAPRRVNRISLWGKRELSLAASEAREQLAPRCMRSGALHATTIGETSFFALAITNASCSAV